MRRPFLKSSFLLGLVICVLFGSTAAVAYLNDTSIYPAPNYYSFVPPAAGGSYADPVFGTTITRVSNAAGTTRADNGGLLQSVEAEYSTKSPFNADNSKILLLEFSYFAIYDSATLKRIKPLTFVSSSSEPLWSRTDPNIFYFHPNNSNRLMTYNVATDAQTLVHTFSEYSSIYSQGESEMSYDGDHLVLAGDGNQIFVYTISTDTKGPVFDASGHGKWDSVYISPNNNVLISWSANGSGRYHGEELYDSNMTFLRQIANNDGHKHMGKDVDGSEVLVQTNSGDPTPIANCPNGIVKIKLATAAQSCLFALGNYDKWTSAVHISAPDQQGWVLVEAYNVSASASPWYPYTNELLQVALDGSYVRRYAQHRSNTATYDGQPHLSVSRDGSRFVFNSNMMGSTPDVYLVALSATAVTSSGSETTTTSGGTTASGEISTTSGGAPITSGGTTVTTTTTTTTTTTATPTTATTARTEQNDSAVSYVGSWYTHSQGSFSGGSSAQAMDPGISATFTFTGVGVRWMGYRDEWSGIANVYLDGQLQATVDTYATPSQAQTEIWRASGLTAATHTLQIKMTGTHNASSAGSWVWIDAFDVDTISTTSATAGASIAPTSTSTTTGTTALSSISGTITATGTYIEQDNAAVSYAGPWSGVWATVKNNMFSGGSAAEAMDKGSVATLNFTGTGVSWIGYKDQWSGIAEVYVDGNLAGQVDTYSAATVTQAVPYAVTGLASGNHQLKIYVTGQKNSQSGGSWVWVNAFDIKP